MVSGWKFRAVLAHLLVMVGHTAAVPVGAEREKVRAVAPLGRWQETEDIADMVVFLSSVRARHVTGLDI